MIVIRSDSITGRPFSRQVFLALSGILSTFSAIAHSAQAAPPGYKMVWREEFKQKENTPPNPAVWNAETGASGWGNQELQNYVRDIEHAHVVKDRRATDGFALQIQATSDGKGGYESARLQTANKATFQYGYIEARIKLAYGQGVWPAFWMLGTDLFTQGVGWPASGEIDIMENIGKQEWWGRNESSLHGPGYSGGNSLHEIYNLPKGKYFKDAYHTFGMLWKEDSVSFYVDGKLFETRTPKDIPGKKWVFNHPFFFIANIAIGGNFPGSPDATTKLPQKMLIDYIRVYQRPGVGSAVFHGKK